MIIDFEKIGKIIANRRAELGITQAALGGMIGVSANSIVKIERGGNKDGGSVAHYIRIAAELGLSLDELFNIDKQKTETTAAAKLDIIKNFIDDFDIELLRSYIDEKSSLILNDDGMAYYIQEYVDIINYTNKLNSDERKEKIKSLLIGDLDEKTNKYMRFNGKSLVPKSKDNCYFEYDQNEHKLKMIIIPF